MKILALSDQECPWLWDYLDRRRLGEIDLILSCGDLKPQYLSFIVTFARAPLLYVHGNHDDRYAVTPPEGCICVENRIYTHQGVRIFGLGGSARYKPDGKHQYTQREMDRRVLRRRWELRRSKGFDILLAHAPALGLNDGDDPCHTGFDAFNGLMDKYKPRYFVHGHMHMTYGQDIPRLTTYGDTQVINAYESYIFEY